MKQQIVLSFALLFTCVAVIIGGTYWVYNKILPREGTDKPTSSEIAQAFEQDKGKNATDIRFVCENAANIVRDEGLDWRERERHSIPKGPLSNIKPEYRFRIDTYDDPDVRVRVTCEISGRAEPKPFTLYDFNYDVFTDEFTYTREKKEGNMQ